MVLQQYATIHGVGFNDLAVNLGLHFVDPQTGVYIQNLEWSWISTKENGINDITEHTVTYWTRICVNGFGSKDIAIST